MNNKTSENIIDITAKKDFGNDRSKAVAHYFKKSTSKELEALMENGSFTEEELKNHFGIYDKYAPASIHIQAKKAADAAGFSPQETVDNKNPYTKDFIRTCVILFVSIAILTAAFIFRSYFDETFFLYIGMLFFTFGVPSACLLGIKSTYRYFAFQKASYINSCILSGDTTQLEKVGRFTVPGVVLFLAALCIGYMLTFKETESVLFSVISACTMLPMLYLCISNIIRFITRSTYYDVYPPKKVMPSKVNWVIIIGLLVCLSLINSIIYDKIGYALLIFCFCISIYIVFIELGKFLHFMLKMLSK